MTRLTPSKRVYTFGLTGSRGRVVSTRLESRGVAERRWPVPRPVAMPNEPAPSARNREGGLSWSGLSKDTRVRRFVVRACRLRFPFHGENHTRLPRERKIRGAVPAKSAATFHITHARTHTRTHTYWLLRQFPCREFFLFLSLPDRVPAFFIFFIIGNNEPAGVTIIKKKVATRIILEKNESRKLVSAPRIEPWFAQIFFLITTSASTMIHSLITDSTLSEKAKNLQRSKGIDEV